MNRCLPPNTSVVTALARLDCMIKEQDAHSGTFSLPLANQTRLKGIKLSGHNAIVITWGDGPSPPRSTVLAGVRRRSPQTAGGLQALSSTRGRADDGTKPVLFAL
jgi:hypothetical protein